MAFYLFDDILKKAAAKGISGNAVDARNWFRVQASKVAADLGVSYTALSNWLKLDAASRAPTAAPPPNPLEEEIRKLRAENRILQMERDILKKAAAFFAKESL